MPRTARGLNYMVTDLRPPWARNKGQPVIFHHGVGASLDIFAEWVPIVGALHPVVRFDGAAVGEVVVPPESHAWSIDELIADLLEVIDALFGKGARPHHGEFAGGTVALAAGLDTPRRFLSVAISNAAIKGGQIRYASRLARRNRPHRRPRGLAARKLMQMRFVPDAVEPEALAWSGAAGDSRPHVAIGARRRIWLAPISERLTAFALPLLVHDADRSPFVSFWRKPAR